MGSLGSCFWEQIGVHWELVDPFWRHFGTLEAPVDTLWELLEPYCIHVRVWVRFEVTFDADLGPQRRPKSAKKRPRGVLRRDPGKSSEKV